MDNLSISATYGMPIKRPVKAPPVYFGPESGVVALPDVTQPIKCVKCHKEV